MKKRRSKVESPSETAGQMPSRGEKVKETVVLSLLNVALPSLDIYSDIGLMINFYVGSRRNPYCDENKIGYHRWSAERFNCYYNDSIPTSDVIYTPHYSWGTMMLLPFLLNYLICWYVWAATEKRKAITWVAALLSFYPQYVACKIIYQIWWVDAKRGLQKKRFLERNIIQFEVFFEAVTSTLVMTYLLVRALSFSREEGTEIIFNWLDMKSTDSVLFFVAFSTSVITSSLGLAKNLKVGPCRILPEQKRQLGGLLSPRFLLIFFACGFTMVGKGFALASAVAESCRRATFASVLPGAAIALSTFFLPGFIIGLIACWHRGIVKTFLSQPSVFLLPMFTHFTCVSNSKPCCTGGEQEERFISFSPISTAVNVGVSVAGILAYVFTLPLIFSDNYTTIHESIFQYLCGTEHYLVSGGLPCSILGLILTLVVAFQCKCCKTSCCASSCSISQPYEYGALLTSSPNTPYILGSDGQLVMEETTDIEENKGKELEESRGSDDLVPSSSSTSIIVESENKVPMEAEKQEKEEKEENKLKAEKQEKEENEEKAEQQENEEKAEKQEKEEKELQLEISDHVA